MTVSQEVPRPHDTVRRVVRSILIVMTGASLNFGVSLLRRRIVAQMFGTQSVYDAYTAADGLAETLVTMFGTLTIAYAFTPVYIQLLQGKEDDRANRLISQVSIILGLLVGFVAALIIAAAPTLVTAPWGLAPGFTPENQQVTILLLRILMLSAIIFTFSGLSTGILHARNHFWLPALSPIVYSAGIIFGVLVLAPKLGIYGLAWGAVLGALLHFLIQVPGLIRYRIHWRLNLNFRDDPLLVTVMILTLPRFIDLLMARLSISWLNNNLASYLGEGRASSIGIAYSIMNIPWTIIGTALGLAIFPIMATLAARKDVDAQRQAVSGGLRAVLLFTIPSAVGLLMLGRPVIRLLYEGGEFTAQSTELVYYALQFYMVALVSQSMLDIVVRAFAAQQDTWTPLKVSFFTTALNVGLALMLTRAVSEGGIEHGGPPLANGIAVLVEASIGLTILHFRWKGVDARHILLDMGKALVAAAAMAITLSLVLPLLEGSTILTLAVGGIVGIAVYLGVAYLLGVREVYTIPMMILHQASGGRLGAAASES